MILYLLIYLLILTSAVMAVVSKKLINSAIMLGILSIGISILLFSYNAPWAGVFELSVCAGLITVLFISAVNLIKHSEDEVKENRVKYTIFPLILLGFIIVSSIFIPDFFSKLEPFSKFNAQKEEKIGTLIWVYRDIDIIAQITLIAASVFVIKHIFSRPKNTDGGNL